MNQMFKPAPSPLPPTAESGRRQQRRLAVLAGLVLCVLYTIHLECCQNSALQYVDVLYENADMHANLVWASGIREQGWLNPDPYHPYTGWMRRIAPYPQWVQWWGGGQIFQQSPLYAYLLAALLPKLFLMRLLQALMGMGTCACLGLLTARIAGRPAGWLAFWLAALYAPFYAYSWPFLRDGLGWFITAALLWALAELTCAEWNSRRANFFAWLAGVLLGLGFLAKENYLLLVPAVLFIVAVMAWQRRAGGVWLRMGLAAGLVIAPLLIRNCCVQAPLLSSSNRFAESFISGNAGSSSPSQFVVPPETGQILRDTRARALPVIRETIASHPDGAAGWLKLQSQKCLSLFDPYESPDNLSYYFMAGISPSVRLGLQFWMLLVPGLAGFFLMSRQWARGHFWLWVFLLAFTASLLVGIPVSRYRQSLMIFFIPWAACYLVFLGGLIRRRQFWPACGGLLILLLGWLLEQGPLARQPRSLYERPTEYFIAAQIYQQLGDERKLAEMQALIHQKFPDLKP
jgi:4-amino-4-deoxy-L-arabinose transferase-like glycosyltransferase